MREYIQYHSTVWNNLRCYTTYQRTFWNPTSFNRLSLACRACDYVYIDYVRRSRSSTYRLLHPINCQTYITLHYGVFIATQLNSTRRRVELRRNRHFADTIQLTRRRVELCRYRRVLIATQLNSTQLTLLNSVQPSQSCFCLWRHDLQTESTGSLRSLIGDSCSRCERVDNSTSS